MNTAKKIYEADECGVVRVELPTGKPGRRVEVLLVWDEADEQEQEDLSDLVGLLKDTPIERPPQGEFEKRDEFK